MGIYNVASEIATMPASELVMPVRRALFPTLSQLADNPGEFSRAVLTSLSALAIACSALGFGLAACASEAVAVILGSRWGDAAPLMRWLAVFGIATAITGLIEVLLWLAGRTKLAAMLSWAELILLLPAVWWGFQTAGTEGIAVARCAIAWLMVPVLLWSVTAAGPVKSFQLAIVVLRPVVAGLVMFALLTAIPWSTHWHVALTILAKVAVGAGVFTTTLYIFWRMAGCPNTAESYVFNGTWWRSLVKNQN